MGLEPGDIDQVPLGLSIEDYYDRIIGWYKASKDFILKKTGRPKNDSYVECYRALIRAAPARGAVHSADIALVCKEVVTGLMEWAYHEKDSHGVKMAAYAYYVLESFFDGPGGETTRASIQQSKLEPHTMNNCMGRKRSSESNH